MMNNPFITIFMAVYNVEDFLEDSLESILNQTYKNFEFLIVNDASTDTSSEILQRYEKKDKRIRIIDNKINKGIPYTRNIGLIEAKGKYIAIMDSDDIALPNRIEKQVLFMGNNLEIDVVGTDYAILGRKFKRKVRNRCTTPEEIKIKFLFNCAIHNPTAMLRKETLDTNKLKYNLDFFVAQDYDLFARLSKIGKIAILPEVLYKYRIGHSNITKKSLSSKIHERKQILATIQKDLLNYYHFTLSDKELEIYYVLFFDNPSSEMLNEHFLDKIVCLVENILQQNNQKAIFNDRLLKKVLLDSICVAISNLNITLYQKINLYSKICGVMDINGKYNHKLYLIAKSMYYSFSNLKFLKLINS